MYQHGDTVIAKTREDGSCLLTGGHLDVVKKNRLATARGKYVSGKISISYMAAIWPLKGELRSFHGDTSE
jgi:hypothetical protein